MTTQPRRATAYAPATVANVGVGFDILGFAFDKVGDEITVERVDGSREITIRKIEGLSDAATRPTDPTKNTATGALLKMQKDLGLPFGFAVSIKKGIPVSSGLGGSAASAVGAVIAASSLLDQPLSVDRQLHYAVAGEKIASGAEHADNVAPCLLGGLVLCRSMNPMDIIPLPIPGNVHCALVHPHLKIDTKVARGILSQQVNLSLMVRQSANLAGFMAACYSGDIRLLHRSLVDLVIEPQRAHLIPGFDLIKKAALGAGAIGCSISGSGPSVFAWAESAPAATRVEQAMRSAVAAAEVEATSWIAPISRQGCKCIS